MIKILVLVLALSACGHDDSKPDYAIDPELQTILADFKADAAARGIELRAIDLRVLKLADATPYDGLAGAALPEDGYFEIYIARPAAENYTFNLKRLTYHELGHAFLGKAHSGTFTSIMNAAFTPIRPDAGTWERSVDEFWSAP